VRREVVLCLDIGPASEKLFCERIAKVRTVLWNGPLGAFEIPPFDAGTNAVAKKVAALTQANHLMSIAGGGDTLSALAHAGALEKLSYVSTAGGAFSNGWKARPSPASRCCSGSSRFSFGTSRARRACEHREAQQAGTVDR
jgi:phosphoglycerate kinase